MKLTKAVALVCPQVNFLAISESGQSFGYNLVRWVPASIAMLCSTRKRVNNSSKEETLCSTSVIGFRKKVYYNPGQLIVILRFLDVSFAIYVGTDVIHTTRSDTEIRAAYFTVRIMWPHPTSLNDSWKAFCIVCEVYLLTSLLSFHFRDVFIGRKWTFRRHVCTQVWRRRIRMFACCTKMSRNFMLCNAINLADTSSFKF